MQNEQKYKQNTSVLFLYFYSDFLVVICVCVVFLCSDFLYFFLFYFHIFVFLLYFMF